MCYCDHDGTQVGMPCPFCGRLNMNPTPTPPKTHAEVAESNDIEDMIQCGHVSHDEARQIIQRFIDGHFNNAGREHPRMTIPANPRRDDDLRAIAYIKSQQKREKELRAAGYLDDAGNVRRDRLNEMREVRGWLSSALDRMELADVTRLPWLAAALTNSYQQLDAFIGERESAALHAKDAHAGE